MCTFSAKQCSRLDFFFFVRYRRYRMRGCFFSRDETSLQNSTASVADRNQMLLYHPIIFRRDSSSHCRWNCVWSIDYRTFRPSNEYSAYVFFNAVVNHNREFLPYWRTRLLCKLHLQFVFWVPRTKFIFMPFCTTVTFMGQKWHNQETDWTFCHFCVRGNMLKIGTKIIYRFLHCFAVLRHLRNNLFYAKLGHDFIYGEENWWYIRMEGKIGSRH